MKDQQLVKEKFKCEHCGGEIFVGYRDTEGVRFYCYRCERPVRLEHYWGVFRVAELALAQIGIGEPLKLAAENLPDREALAIQLVAHCLKRGSLQVIVEPPLRQGQRIRIPDLLIKLPNGREIAIEVKAASPSGIHRPRWYFNHLKAAAAQGDILILVGFPLQRPEGSSPPEPAFFVFRSEEIPSDALAISIASERDKPLKWWDHRVNCQELGQRVKELANARMREEGLQR